VYSRQQIENKPHSQGMQGLAPGVPSPVLLISVSNVSIPVTLDNIYSICAPFGEVLRIITFTRGNVHLCCIVSFHNSIYHRLVAV
jgi:hypothetical protein